jgi:hypothetical protein
MNAFDSGAPKVTLVHEDAAGNNSTDTRGLPIQGAQSSVHPYPESQTVSCFYTPIRLADFTRPPDTLIERFDVTKVFSIHIGILTRT